LLYIERKGLPFGHVYRLSQNGVWCLPSETREYESASSNIGPVLFGVIHSKFENTVPLSM
jgi:hypothetical protein